MTRRKVKLAFINNNSSRKTTYKKRKRGLLKKAHEIFTLCGINAGAIIYSPYDPTPEVWPSVEGMNQVITTFRNLPEIDRHNNMVNQQEFVQQKITKADKLLLKKKKDNREVNLTENMVMFESIIRYLGNSNLCILDLNDLGYLVDQYLKSLNRMIQILEGDSDVEIGESLYSGIFFFPYDPTPERWPSVEGMNQVITTYRNLPEIDWHNNMFNQQEFVQQRITKADKLLLMKKKDNREGS
ncbi:agamous-like MADS-box protein AGL80 [Raphanus sativus]|uniref:Agamous-like MADS-box protein AGL80 n=1 Tax=Raphanus sativus TaxID=3726 RepID=A0A9W3C792_RAPSA|nr:agamous-like MADS-box protein AGL80 [Raphanus sativus]